MSLRLEGYIDLPEHRGPGGFDHPAVHRELRRLYVAHTANDAVDVIDLDEARHLESIVGLTGVGGALVSESLDLVFTSNRGEDTVAILGARNPGALAKVPVGRRPNGLAFDPSRRTLLVANVGDDDPASHTLSIVDSDRAVLMAAIASTPSSRRPIGSHVSLRRDSDQRPLTVRKVRFRPARARVEAGGSAAPDGRPASSF